MMSPLDCGMNVWAVSIRTEGSFLFGSAFSAALDPGSLIFIRAGFVQDFISRTIYILVDSLHWLKWFGVFTGV